MRDRLRAVECLADKVDVMGVWQTTRLARRYGTGWPIEVKAKWMSQFVDQD